MQKIEPRKKNSLTFHYTGFLIGIHIMAYNPLYTLTNQFFFTAQFGTHPWIPRVTHPKMNENRIQMLSFGRILFSEGPWFWNICIYIYLYIYNSYIHSSMSWITWIFLVMFLMVPESAESAKKSPCFAGSQYRNLPWGIQKSCKTLLLHGTFLNTCTRRQGMPKECKRISLYQITFFSLSIQHTANKRV